MVLFLFSGRGVGKMILRLMQGFFGTGSEPEELTKKGMSGAIYLSFLLFQLALLLYFLFMQISV